MEVRVGDGFNNGFMIIGDNADMLGQSRKFWRLFDKMYSTNLVRIKKIEEKWSLWNKNKELVFALFRVEYLDDEDNTRSVVIFYRSDAVAVFLVLKDRITKKKYVALVEQIRVPAGQKLLEIPAGSVESDDDFLTTAVREIEEEVTLKIAQSDLKFLGQYILSPGACNEVIALYACELTLTGTEIKSLEGRWAGLKEEGENIKVRLFPLEVFEGLGIRDAKTMLAYGLYLRQASK